MAQSGIRQGERDEFSDNTTTNSSLRIAAHLHLKICSRQVISMGVPDLRLIEKATF